MPEGPTRPTIAVGDRRRREWTNMPVPASAEMLKPSRSRRWRSTTRFRPMGAPTSPLVARQPGSAETTVTGDPRHSPETRRSRSWCSRGR
jgi:hypothetical protein